MLHALAILLLCQLAGEAGSKALALPLPGPVLGMVFLVLALIAIPRLGDVMRPVTRGILGHMSLLFVPAGVGVVGHFAALGGQGLGLMLALALSTIVAISVGAVTFATVARLTGNRDD
jgi:holin-like protein